MPTYIYPTNVTGYVELATWVNSTTFGYFFFLALMGFFVTIMITLIAGKGKEAKNAFLIAAFVCMILGFIMRIMSLITDIQAAAFFILFIGGIIWEFLD